MYECKQQRVFIDVVVSPLWNAVTALTDWREPLDHLDENKAASPFCPMLIKEKLRTNLGKQRITPGPYLLCSAVCTNPARRMSQQQGRVPYGVRSPREVFTSVLYRLGSVRRCTTYSKGAR